MPLMTPALAAQAAQAALEEELRALQKKERELEGRLRALDKGGKGKPRSDESEPRGLKRSANENGDAESEAPQRTDDNEESRKRVKEDPAAAPAAEEPRVTSSVTRPERTVPQESTETRNRNKRLFGRSLLGTLQQAKKETVSEKRKQLEETIENKVKEDREMQHKLLIEEKEKDAIALEEVKRMRQEKEKQLQDHKQKERERMLANFKPTTAKPQIYWRPKQKADEQPAAELPAAAAVEDDERPRTPPGEAPAEEPATTTS